MKHTIKTLTRYALLAGLSFQLLGAQETPDANGAGVNDTKPEGPVYQLDDYVVTGTALPMRAFEAASAISVLGGEEKLRRQAGNLGETLDYLPSVATINTGSGVGQPVIRGLSGNRIRVLQDGVGGHATVGHSQVRRRAGLHRL